MTESVSAGPVSNWINKTSMQSLRSLAIIVGFLFVVFAFGGTSIRLFWINNSVLGQREAASMVQADTTRAVLEAAAAIRAAAQTTETSNRNYAMQLATALFTLIAVAIGANVGGQAIDRFSSREHGESKAKIAKAKSEGTEAARINAANGHTTKERPAMQINAENAEITQEVSSEQPRPKPSGDARVDDESGS